VAGLSRPLRWSVVIARFSPVEGHEQGGTRRALVVSYESRHRSGLLTVCPITAARPPRYPGEIRLPKGTAGQTRNGVILCSHVRTISASRVVAVAGRLANPNIRAEVRAAVAMHLGLDLMAWGDGAAGVAHFE
jgi:mRNA-degrading endonuclease toxin of MazEF toxin-antitoxin module